MLDTSETEKGRTHMQTIGFIGTGIMGQGMIRNLMKAGYPVQIYNRTRSKAEALEREGAVWKDSAAQCAAGCGVVITIVGYPQDVEEVYFGPGGLLESAQPGTVLIDMTTTSPKLAQRIVLELKDKVAKGFVDGINLEDVGAATAAPAAQGAGQAIAALVSLGYSQSEAALAVSKIDASLPVEEIIKLALRGMAGRR